MPWLLGIAFTAIYATISLARYHRLSTSSWDNGIFEQAVRAYAHLQAPIVNIKGPGYNVLGDHFSPIIALLAPVYRVFPHAQTLLVAQAGLVALSIVPIACLGMRRLGTAAGLALAVAYGLSFGVQAAIDFDFHEVAFAAPLLAFAGVAYVERRWRAVAAWTLPLLLVKEDLSATVVAVGIVLFIAGARRLGAMLAATGVVALGLIVRVIIPAFNQNGTYDYTSALGGGLSGMRTTFLTGWDIKATTLLLGFAITGFLALRSPWALVAVPTFAWRFVGSNEYYWGTGWHYSLVVMPIVFAALIDGAERCRRGGLPWLRDYASHVPTAALGIALVLSAGGPVAGLLHANTYRAPPEAEAAYAAMGAVPVGASVESDLQLLTHLTSDRTVYWIGTVGDTAPDYILITTETSPDIMAYAQATHPGSVYREIFDYGGYQVAERVG